MHCGFAGGRNLFAELPHQLGCSGEPYWMVRGGHRLWTAPEVAETYALDNSPVKVTTEDGFISLLQPVDPQTLLQKEISIRVEDSGEILVTHRIENRGPINRHLSAWALTAMAPGGVAITTFPDRNFANCELQPTHPLVMWSYTDFTDPRWTFASKYLVLRQDPSVHSPQKAGLFHPHSFACYLLGSDLFVKRSYSRRTDPYPDFHSSVELFTNQDFLELETLGAYINLRPDSSVAHLEHWYLYRNIEFPGFSDDEIDTVLMPIIEATTLADEAS